MSDIATIWQGTYGDWSLGGDNADLVDGQDVETAILISVFTDRVLPVGVDPPDGTDDPRGWWADDPEHPIGSRIWTLLRAKRTDQTLADAQAFLVEALQWLIDDLVVDHFDITTEWDDSQGTPFGFLAATVTAYKPSGPSAVLAFSWAWDGIL
jgi:phage gp46-like protein